MNISFPYSAEKFESVASDPFSKLIGKSTEKAIDLIIDNSQPQLLEMYLGIKAFHSESAFFSPDHASKELKGFKRLVVRSLLKVSAKYAELARDIEDLSPKEQKYVSIWAALDHYFRETIIRLEAVSHLRSKPSEINKLSLRVREEIKVLNKLRFPVDVRQHQYDWEEYLEVSMVCEDMDFTTIDWD